MRSVGRGEMRKRLGDSSYQEGCFFGPCMAALRAATGVPIALTATISGQGSNYSFVITLVDTKAGVLRSQVSQTCEVCTVEEALSTATLATISLVTRAEEGSPSIEEGEASTTGPAPPRRRSNGMRIASYAMIGVGAAMGVAGAILWKKDSEKLGIAGVASGASLVAAGSTMWFLSGRF